MDITRLKKFIMLMSCAEQALLAWRLVMMKNFFTEYQGRRGSLDSLTLTRRVKNTA
ncbi:hypothetical protein DF3PB_5560001 [uncultured Defluviicoccus sp.]|uniref:Uncharacterized protein n=1 Tax=metagenome TaxID=256318 RepID=A0A380TJY5_9ZZZZ|nr:hypothetical protein DF3PB_5560001 [uncultured Defluviicoccus sp.]